MSEERFVRVKEILAEALNLPPKEQAAYAREHCAGDADLCAEVLELLAYADDARDISSIDHAQAAQALSHSLPTLDESALPDIEGYRILRTLGVGGMGTVFEAEQDQPRRRVALKMIRGPVIHGESIRQRFALEAEILGRLNHPSIAKVFDAGMTPSGIGSVPYFVMELIHGEAVDRWVELEKPDLRALMQLLLRICEGVEHAHQNGVIHRDLKPANILVDTDGIPRILDFGIARVTTPDLERERANTLTGQIMGTLDYMSPEQVSGNPHLLDTRSDIYALGVIAYELITGVHPLPIQGKSLPQVLKIIAEVNPTPLRAHMPKCPQDVALIIEKTLTKDKERRYASASAFTEDIERWLSGAAISARPPSAIYQFKKFAGRHRVAVASASLVLLSLIGGIIGIAWKAQEARNERDKTEIARKIAVRETDIARASVKVLKDGIIAAAHPDALGPNARIKDVFIRAAEGFDEAYAEYPEVDAAMRTTLTEVWIGLGLWEKAAVEAKRVVELRQDLHGHESVEVGQALSIQAEALEKRSRYKEAEVAVKRAINILEKLPSPQQPARAQALNTLGWIQRSQGHRQEAEQSMLLALRLRRELYPEGSETLATSLNDLAIIKQDLRQLDEAAAYHQECLEMRERIHGTVHSKVAQSRNNLGLLLRNRGMQDEAAEEFRKVLSIYDELGIKEHPNLASTWFNLSLVLNGEEKLKAVRQAFDMAGKVYGEDSFERNHFGLSLGICLDRAGQHNLALEHTKEAIEGNTKILGKNHPRLSHYYLSYAYPLRATNQIAMAEAQIREALRICTTNERAQDKHLIHIHRDLSGILQLQHKYADAEAHLLKAHGMSAKLFGAAHKSTQDLVQGLIKLAEAWANPDKIKRYQAMLSSS